MIVVLNYLLPLVVLFLVFISWKLKNWHPLLLAVVVSIVYTIIQPSYMPKGTVKPLPTSEFKVVDTPIVDLGRKTKTAEEYDAARNTALQEIDNSINQKIKSQKEQ